MICSGWAVEQPRVCVGDEEPTPARPGEAERHRIRQADPVRLQVCQGSKACLSRHINVVFVSSTFMAF